MLKNYLTDCPEFWMVEFSLLENLSTIEGIRLPKNDFYINIYGMIKILSNSYTILLIWPGVVLI